MILHCPYCHGIHRFDQQTIFLKLIFNFQIFSAIFWLTSTFPLALEFVTILDWKQSHHFSSFWEDLKYKVQKVKYIGRNRSKKSAVWLANHFGWSGLVSRYGNKQKIWKIQSAVTFCPALCKSVFFVMFWIDFKSITFYFLSNSKWKF